MRLSLFIFVVLAFLVAPVRAAPTAADAGSDGEADAMYADFEQASRDYRQAIEQSVQGGRRAARRAADKAMDRMLDIAQQCAETEGCDRTRFMAGFDALLGARSRIVGEDDAREAAATTEQETTSPNASGAPLTDAGSPVLEEFPSAADTLNQLNGRDLRELIVQNEAVRAAMAEWLTSLRPQLINAHEQYQYLRFLMWPEYERAGLPEALLFAIMARESGGRVHAISPAGAAGLMQFMPATGKRFGLGWENGFDTRFEPQLASRASTEYLNERFAQLGHNLEFALAAYNGGEGRMGRIARQNPGKTFWDPAVYNALPQETRDYVPYILAAAWLYLHPEDYGLSFSRVNGAATVLKLDQAASLNQLTICVGNGGTRYGYFRALRNLNPRWLPETELPAGTELRVPVDVVPLYRTQCVAGRLAERSLALVKARKPSAGPAASAVAASGARHTVRRGDTLSAIARRYGCNAQAMARANGLRSPYALRPGQHISLIGCRG